MTIDVATLVFDFKSDSAAQAEKAMDRLIERGDRLEVTSKKVRLATDRMNDGLTGATGAAQRAAQANVALVQSEGAVEKATRSSATAAGDLRRLRALDAAQMKADAAAAKAIAAERAAADRTAAAEAKARSVAVRDTRQLDARAMAEVVKASKDLDRDQAKAARSAAALDKQFNTLRASMDATAAVEVKLADRTRILDAALAKGRITQEQHTLWLGKANAAAAAGAGIITKYGAAAALSSHQLTNLSFQLNDVVTGLVSGQKPMQILAQQGGQVFQALQMGAGGVSGSIKALLSFLTPTVLLMGTFVTVAIAAAAASVVYASKLAKLGEITEGVGRQSGLAASQIKEIAKANAEGSGASIGQAEALASALLKTGKVGGEVFGDLIKIQKRYSLATGQDLKAAQAELAGSFADPARGAEVLSDKLSGLDGKTKQLIASLIAQGREFEAQKVLADAYERALDGAASTSQTLGGQIATLGTHLSNAAGAFGEFISKAQSYITLGPQVVNQLRRQGEEAARQRQGLAAVNNASAAGSDLFLRLNPDAGARRQLQGDLSIAARGLTASRALGDQQGIDQNTESFLRASRALQTYIPAAEKAHQLATLDAKANEVKALKQTAATRAKLADIEADKVRIQLAGQALTAGEVNQRVRDEAARTFARQDRASNGPRDQSQQAIDTATKAEISARTALTKNIEVVATLRREEADAESAAARHRIERGVADGSINKAAAATAITLTARAAAEKKELIDREEAAAIAQRELAQRQAIGPDLDRLAAIQASTARNATEQGQIEMRALDARQELDRAILAERTTQQVIWGEITERAQAELLISQLAVQQAEKGAAERAANIRTSQEATALAQAELDLQAETLRGQADLSRSAYERSVIGADILKLEHQIQLLKADEAVRLAVAGSDAQKLAELQREALRRRQAVETKLAAREKLLVNAIGEATSSVRGFKDAFRRHDWARVFDELQRTIQTIQASFAANGLGGGLLTAGSAAASLIGGKGGRAVAGGLGVAGLGLGLGAMATSASLGSVGLVTGLTGSAALGGAVGSGLAALGAVAAPLALAAGALYIAAKLFNVGGKPSNKGAGYDLVTGAITGKSRDAETEQAAVAAGDAIKAIQDSLKAAGIGLKDAVTGLVIGTRDQTQIYLQSGKTLLSAVGDSGAAVDTAMRALIEGATFVSEAQKKLVDSAVAAGKGFDAVAEVLAAYEAAQGIGKALADQILQLTEPQAFDTEAVKRDIQAQREAYAKLTAEGYLTVDQLAGINVQLATLEGLRLDEVMARYGAAVDNAAQRLADAQAVTDGARGDLITAYNAEADIHRQAIDRYKQIVDGLKSFRRELDIGSLAGRNPIDQLAATRREFNRLSALPTDSADRMANLQAVSQAFLEASKVASPTQLAFDRDLNAVRRATEASQTAAQAQVDSATQQLVALTSVVGQLVDLNAGVMTVAQAINALTVAMAAERAAGGNPTMPANDNLPGSIQQYLADNKDLARNWNAGGSLRSAGSTLEDAALAHYRTTGQYEIAAGLRKFATGGDFMVGGSGGTDSQLVQFMASPDETVSIRTPSQRGGDNSDLIAEVRALRSEISALKAPAQKTADATAKMENRQAIQDIRGVWVRGETPDDPVQTVAA